MKFLIFFLAAGFLYNFQGQAHRVMTDHVRRLPFAVEYFLPYNDQEFLTNVVFRNAREIMVWLRDAKPTKEDYKFIKITVRGVMKIFHPTRSVVKLYLITLSLMPRELCAFQRILNRIRTFKYV